MFLRIAVSGVLLAVLWANLPFPMSVEKAMAKLPAPEDALEQKLGCVATVLTNPQGVSTYVRRWVASEGASKGAVVIVHGLTWHSEYFAPLARRLAGAGFDVVAYDLQGHGRSGTIDGMKGYAARFDHWVAELDTVIKWEVAHHPGSGRRVTLMGESMGGSIVLRALTADAPSVFASLPDVKSVVLSGPVVKVAKEVLPPPPVVAVIRAMASVFPRLSVPSSEVADGFEGAFGDKEFAARAKVDPLVMFDSPRLRTAAEVLGTVDTSFARAPLVTQPLLVLHGVADKRTESVNSEALVARVASTDKKLLLLDGANHQLLQDTPATTARVMAEVVDWLTQRA